MFLMVAIATLAIFGAAASATPMQFTVIEDAYTDSRDPQKTSPYNHPDGRYLWSGQFASQDAHSYSFLKFKVGDWIWKNSELQLYCNYTVGSFAITTKIWYLPDDSWSSDSVTYDNQPDFWSDDQILDEKYISSTGWVSFDTSAIFGLETDQKITLVIGSLLPNEVAVGDYWRDFENLEYGGGHAATLSGTNPINPVPEPATMLLLGSCLIGAAGFASRKKLAKK